MLLYFEIAYYDSFGGIILEAVKPGSAKLKVFTLWWRDSVPKYLDESLFFNSTPGIFPRIFPVDKKCSFMVHMRKVLRF